MKTSPLKSFRTLAVLLMSVAAPSVYALTITPVFDASFTASPNSAALQTTVNNALAAYSSNLADSNNFTITFAFSGTVVGAQSSYNATSVLFSDYRNALVTRASGATDATVLTSIGLGPKDPVLNASNISISQALAFTVGLGGAQANYGTVTFGSNEYGNNEAGFLGTVQHEVNEVLGISSSLPNFDSMVPGNNVLPTEISPSDLFRFTAGGARSFTLNSSSDPTDKAFFRLSSASSNLQQFNSLPNGGDYGDWYTEGDRMFSDAPQDQSGPSTTFTSMDTSPNSAEYVMLDAVGYNLVPEPTSLALLALGTLGLLGSRRRNRA